jgi:phage regulator Rha-like protein
MNELIPHEHIERRIFTIRKHRVMLDSDLAELYGVETRALSQAVKRNEDRFPEDFMFRLTGEEKAEVITVCDNPDKIRFSPVNPRVFTEHGTLMLANVLNSKRAVAASIRIVRAFTKLRQALMIYSDLKKKIEEIEVKLADHDDQFQIFQELILPLLEVSQAGKRKIGFELDRKKKTGK